MWRIISLFLRRQPKQPEPTVWFESAAAGRDWPAGRCTICHARCTEWYAALCDTCQEKGARQEVAS